MCEYSNVLLDIPADCGAFWRLGLLLRFGTVGHRTVAPKYAVVFFIIASWRRDLDLFWSR